jgi:hypothetical protein
MGASTGPSSTKFLMHADGTNGSTTFTDSSNYANTITASGSVAISTTQSVFGGSSVRFNGSGNYLTVTDSLEFLAGTGDFCFEAAVWIDSGSFSTSGLQGLFNLGAYNIGILVRIRSTFIEVFVVNGSNNFTYTWTTDAWQRIAVSRQSGSVKVFIDGTQVGSTQTMTGDIGSVGAQTYDLTFGRSRHDSTERIIGYVDEARLSIGAAVRTANYTVDASAFTS